MAAEEIETSSSVGPKLSMLFRQMSIKRLSVCVDRPDCRPDRTGSHGLRRYCPRAYQHQHQMNWWWHPAAVAWVCNLMTWTLYNMPIYDDCTQLLWKRMVVCAVSDVTVIMTSSACHTIGTIIFDICLFLFFFLISSYARPLQTPIDPSKLSGMSYGPYRTRAPVEINGVRFSNLYRGESAIG